MARSPDPNLPSEMQGGYLKEIMLDGPCDEKFLCNFCGKILREPVQSYCGHRFCRSCVESQIRYVLNADFVNHMLVSLKFKSHEIKEQYLVILYFK